MREKESGGEQQIGVDSKFEPPNVSRSTREREREREKSRSAP
jgi:hypothetical protein